LQAGAQENTRHNKKERHPKTEKENIEIRKRGILLNINVSVQQPAEEMPKADQDDTDTPGIVDPGIPIPAENFFTIKQIIPHAE
jgi:hypothetical protein